MGHSIPSLADYRKAKIQYAKRKSTSSENFKRGWGIEEPTFTEEQRREMASWPSIGDALSIKFSKYYRVL